MMLILSVRLMCSKKYFNKSKNDIYAPTDENGLSCAVKTVLAVVRVSHLVLYLRWRMQVWYHGWEVS